MRYKTVKEAVFISRPNRFIAEVELDGMRQTVHVKNTGRCRELLVPGCAVYVSRSDNAARKTQYDLIAVRKGSGLLVNIDSQAPNCVVGEWLARQGFSVVRPEYPYGASRLDFYTERETAAGVVRGLMEVKGCTLEIGGVGYFPDAPTQRGVKHIHELIRAKREGYEAALAFVIQMDGIAEVRPNTATDPAFGAALAQAREENVAIQALLCHVEPDSLTVVRAISQ